MVTHYPNPRKGKHTEGKRVEAGDFTNCRPPLLTHIQHARYCMNDTHVSLMRDPFAANPSCASSAGGARAVTA